MVYKSSAENNMHVCPQCNHHFRIGADTRIQYLVDEGTFEEQLTDLTSNDPLNFEFRGTTYKERLQQSNYT